jgi:L-alanine-DL-glutamate epimerase-like enolase superfamily enzyme
MRIGSISVAPLSVPLLEPFVIASARVDTTRAVLVSLQVSDERSGRSATGLGEAAALPPVTREDQPDLLATLERAAARLDGEEIEHWDAFSEPLGEACEASPVARAALESAWLDACARLAGVPVCTLLRGRAARPLVTDITLPIAEPERMAQLAAAHRARGFGIFKVKVGRSLDDDVRALHAVHARVPDARFRLDANGGYRSDDAIALIHSAHSRGISIECFEQPCARDDLDGMARVRRESGVPVIADESVRDDQDLSRVLAAHAADGVNLKLAKTGGLLATLALGERAHASGLHVMCGGMVETRLGITAMAHVACALQHAEYVDLDTAFLLADERFAGGYRADGAALELTGQPGLDITLC